MTNPQKLTADMLARVDALADGSARRQPKDGGSLRAAHREQAAERKSATPAKSPAAKQQPSPDKLSRDANREMKRVMVAAMRAVDFDALSKGDDAYPDLRDVKPALMRAEVERHCRYLEPKK